MYYSICRACGATLDPNEKCTCDKEIEKYKKRVKELTIVNKNGQICLRI